MKKSNIISIAFLIFFFGTIFTMYIDANAHTNKNGDDQNNTNSNFITEDKELNDFSVIVAKKHVKINIKSHATNIITESYFKNRQASDSILLAFKKPCEYHIINDTLFIDKTFTANVTIKSKSLKKVDAKEKSHINLTKFNTDKFIINSNNAKINGNNVTLKQVKIKAVNNSNINLYNSKIDSLNVYLDHSYLKNSRNQTKKINSTLRNGSNLTSAKPKLLNINSDESSRYSIYN